MLRKTQILSDSPANPLPKALPESAEDSLKRVPQAKLTGTRCTIFSSQTDQVINSSESFSTLTTNSSATSPITPPSSPLPQNSSKASEVTNDSPMNDSDDTLSGGSSDQESDPLLPLERSSQSSQIEQKTGLQPSDQTRKDSLLANQAENLKKVLQTYQEYQEKGAGFGGYWRRWSRGYAYHGNLSEVSENFVKLIDYIALMDSNKVWVRTLNEWLNEKTTAEEFNRKNQEDFLDLFYRFFFSWQVHYYKNKEAQLIEAKKKLIRHYKNSEIHYFEGEEVKKAAIPPVENLEDPSKTHQESKKVYENGENKPETTQQNEAFAGIAVKKKEVEEILGNYFDKVMKGEKIINNITKLNYDINQIKEAFDEQEEIFTQQAKVFKQTIHHFAQEFNLPLRIKKKRDTKFNTANSAENLTNSGESKHEIPNVYENKENESETNQISENPWEIIKPSKYTIANIEKTTLPLPNSKEAKKQKRKVKNRQIRSITAKVAFWIANISSIGEGCIAAGGLVALLSTLALLPAFAFLSMVPIAVPAIIGCLSGWYINRLLFKSDTESVLNDIFVKKLAEDGEEHRLIFLVKDAEGKYVPIDPWKKLTICIVGTLSLFTGIVSGALNFMQTLSFLPASTTLGAILGITSAAFPAVAVSIAIAWIFFKVIADFIKYDRLKQIKNYVYKTFYDVPWREMSSKERGKHIGKCLARILICGIAIGITAFVTFASFGVFYNSCVDLIGKIATTNPTVYLSKISTWINSIIPFLFQVETTNGVAQSILPNKHHTFCGALKLEEAVEKKEEHKLNTSQEETDKPQKNEEEKLELNALQKEAANLQKIEMGMVMASTLINGAGQGGLVGSSGNSLSFFSSTANKIISNFTVQCFSGCPNFFSGKKATEENCVSPTDSKKVEKIAEEGNHLKHIQNPRTR